MTKTIYTFAAFLLFSSAPFTVSAATPSNQGSIRPIISKTEIPIPDPNSSRNPIGKLAEIPIPDPNSSKNPIGSAQLTLRLL